MKIKKTLSAILSLALASSISVGLVACGGNGDKTAGGGGGGNKPVVSEKVTKEQWESAFTATNFINGTVKLIETTKGEIRIGENTTVNGTATITTEAVIANDKQYTKTSYSATGDKALVDFASAMVTEERYTLRYDGDAANPIYLYYGNKDPYGDDFRDVEPGKMHWMVRAGEFYGKGLFDDEIEDLLDLKPFYEAFEYNDAKKGYTIKEDADNREYFDEGMVLKFKDYKVVAVESENVRDKTTYTKSYTITYGNQTITLPTLEASPYDGTWMVSYIKDDRNNVTYQIGETIESYFGMTPVELAADTVKLVLNKDGTATYKYLDKSNPCVWEYIGDRIVLFSNNLASGGTNEYLDFDADSGCITLRLDSEVYLYLTKQTA